MTIILLTSLTKMHRYKWDTPYPTPMQVTSVHVYFDLREILR